MKTKPLTFLLSLTFLFLFNGNSFGDLKKQVAKKQVAKKIVKLDKKDESVVLFCPRSEGGLERYVSVNMKEKTIKTYNLRGNMLDTVYKIIEGNDVVVEGVGVEGSRNPEKSITVHRNSHFDKKKIHVGNLGREKRL